MLGIGCGKRIARQMRCEREVKTENRNGGKKEKREGEEREA